MYKIINISNVGITTTFDIYYGRRLLHECCSLIKSDNDIFLKIEDKIFIKNSDYIISDFSNRFNQNIYIKKIILDKLNTEIIFMEDINKNNGTFEK